MVMSLDFAECDRARASRVILAMTVGFSPGSAVPAFIADPSVPFARQGQATFSFFRPPRRPKRQDFGLVCGAAPRPRHFPMPGSEAAQPSSVRHGLLSRRALSTKRERRSSLGMGRRQLARLFARHLKASPSAVARTARIQRAKRLIDETDKPMVEIAVLAGFGSLRRFNAVFAEVYGRAPTVIRRGRRSVRIRHEADPAGGNKNEQARRLPNRSEGIAAR